MRKGVVLLFALLALVSNLHGARPPRSAYERDQVGMWNEVLSNLQTLRHGLANHEEELRIFEERFKTQEEIIDSLRGQLNETLTSLKEMVRFQSTSLESKIQQQENSAKGLSTNMKTFSNESMAALSEYKQRIQDLEKTILLQNKNIENLQSALRTLSEALVEKGDDSENNLPLSTKLYLVKAGDNLEKIARNHNTSIKKLKDLNALTGSQIKIGQKLQIPE